MPKLTVFQPAEILNPGDSGGPDLSGFAYGFLTQGDSWFSTGAMPPYQTTNLLIALDLQSKAYAVNCAYPGDHLRHMIDARQDPQFLRLLVGSAVPRRWDAILLSAGGNDIIDAAAVLPQMEDGSQVPADRRLLLKPDEWEIEDGSEHTAARYISSAGLALFEVHLVAQFRQLIELRDSEQVNRDVPVFIHCYDYPMPRNASACFMPGGKSWLYTALRAYQIPPADWFAVSRYLLDELKRILQSLDLPQLFVVDTTGTLQPAESEAEGESADWANEIHPTPEGYGKLAAKYAAAIDQHFAITASVENLEVAEV